MTLAEAARAFLVAAERYGVARWVECLSACNGDDVPWNAYRALRAAMAEHDARCAQLRGKGEGPA